MFTVRDCRELKYGTEKSTTCSRSSVIVDAAATMSNWSPATAVKIVSKSAFTHSTSSPRRLAISSVMSTSNPVSTPALTDSNGV